MKVRIFPDVPLTDIHRGIIVDFISFVLINNLVSDNSSPTTNANSWEKYGYTKSLSVYILDNFNNYPIPYVIAFVIIVVLGYW